MDAARLSMPKSDRFRFDLGVLQRECNPKITIRSAHSELVDRRYFTGTSW